MQLVDSLQRGDKTIKDTETKRQFIELRAEGQSYAEIAKQLHISKSTCTSWAAELETEITSLQGERLQELYTVYGMTKEARIKQLGETLRNIDAALSTKDLAELPADRLLELKLKYTDQLQHEYMEPVPQFNAEHAEDFLQLYMQLIYRAQSGQLQPAQINAQLSVIDKMQRIAVTINKKQNPLSLGIFPEDEF